MEKTREARRSTTMAASYGVKNRSQRISESSSEQMHHEVSTTVGDGPGKKERDPESLNRSKRRRCGRYERDVEEDNSDDDDVQHNYHSKSFPSGRISRHVSSLKVADEMIGVPVPRKARSACIKRSHDCKTSSGSGGGGFGEDRRRPPASPGSYSFEVVSPSCSTLSVKQKHKKNGNGYKSGIPKPPKSSGTVEDDLEIEIAEVLSGLKKQPHRSKREHDSENSLTPVEANGAKKLKTEEDDFLAGFVNCRSTNGIKTSSSPKQRLDSRDSEVSKGEEGPLLANTIRDETNNCGSKVEIDLMVPPTISSSPGRVSLPPLVSDYCKRDSYVQSKEQVITKTETIAEEITQKKVDISERLNLDIERPNQETSGDSNLRSQNFDWSDHQAKSVSAPQSSVLPSPVAASSWPSGLPAQGNVHSIQNCKTVDDCSGSSTLVQDAPLCASQRMPKRCATHFFIAQNIQLHQHFAKTKHLPTPNKGSAYLKGGDLRLATGNTSLQGSSSILCSYSQPDDRIADNSCPPKDKASESGHFATSRQKKPQSPPASSSLLPAPAFIFPTNQHLQPVMLPSKSPLPIKSQRVVVGSASVNFSHPNSSASEASLPYFTVLPNNAYSVQMSSTIRGGSPSQTLPFFNGSCYSPHTFQQQPSQLLQTQSQAQRESKASSCSSTSRNQRHQASVNSLSSQANIQQHCQQSQRSEAKAAGDNSVLRGNHTHKGGQYGQTMTPPGQPQNFSMSFASFTSGAAPTNLNFSSNGYHIIPAPPVGHQQNHQASDLKTGRGGSCSKSNSEDLKKNLQGKPQAKMNAQTLFFDNPSRTLNFVSGSWLPPTAMAINGDPLVFTQHLTQKQQQSGRSKMITQSQADSVSVTSSQWKNPATSSITSTSSLDPTKFQSLQPVRKYGQTQISFAAASKPQPSQGQQGRAAGYSTPVIGSASHSQAANPKGSNSKAMPLSEHAQEQTDNSALGSTQKTSPVCRRTVPPIITSSPNHLSELKY